DVEMYDPHVDINVPVPRYPASIFLIGTNHPEFLEFQFPKDSIVIDPWRYLPEQPGVKLVSVGRAPVQPRHEQGRHGGWALPRSSMLELFCCHTGRFHSSLARCRERQGIPVHTADRLPPPQALIFSRLTQIPRGKDHNSSNP